MSNKIKNLYSPLLLLGVFVFVFWVSFSHVKNLPLKMEEGDILHAVEMKVIYNKVIFEKLPKVPYLFYEYGYYILSNVLPNMHIKEISRILNCLLLATNSILFFFILRIFFNQKWSLFGMILFTFTNGIFYTSVLVKTESLLLFQLLIIVLLCHKMTRHEETPFRICLVAFFSGLAFSTKYLPTYPALVIGAMYFKRNPKAEETVFKTLKDVFTDKKFIYFIIFYLLTIIVTGPLHVSLQKMFGKVLEESYFVDSPAIMRSVDELFSFPFGRFSYPLLFTIPWTAGILNYLIFFLALIKKVVPREVLFVWGGFSFLHFLMYCSITLIRVPYYYTLCVPFIVFCSLFLWRKIYLEFKGPILKTAIVGVLILFSSWEYRMWYDMYTNFAGTMLKNQKIYENLTQEGKNVFVLVHPVNYKWLPEVKTNFKNLTPKNVDYYIEQEKPDYIFAFSAYIENVCKYRWTTDYKRQCQYFRQLITEKKNYQLVKKTHTYSPVSSFLYPDPEFEQNFYLLKKIN